MSDFITARVHCCVCNGSGNVPKFHFWSKPCTVCEGTGKRMILIGANMSPADQDRVRQSALYGSINMFPRSLSEDIFGFKL